MSNYSRDFFEDLQRNLTDKQTAIDVQREDFHQHLNETFQKVFEQLIELRRSCRNEIEQQTLNIQIELQQMIDAVQHIQTKNLFDSNDSSEVLRIEDFRNRLNKFVLSPPRHLENLASYLTSALTTSFLPYPDSFSPINTTDPTTMKDLNHFKFGSSIALVHPCDMIASNGRSILSYAIEKNFLNYSTITGSHLSGAKVYRLLAPISANNTRLWDMIWCSSSQFYVIVANLGLYSVSYPYDRDVNCTEHSPQVTKLVSFRAFTFQHVRIASHEMGWYVYMIEHQSVSIDLYDRRSGQRLRHFDNHIRNDLLPLGFHGFCLNEKFFAIVKKTEVLSTINNPHQIQNEQTVQVYFFDLSLMSCVQQMSLCHSSNVSDIKCCYSKNIFFILAEPIQLILVDLDSNELLRKKLLDDGKHLCVVNDNEVFILRSECSIQTLQYR